MKGSIKLKSSDWANYLVTDSLKLAALIMIVIAHRIYDRISKCLYQESV
ncbi:hypothetical protein HQ584_08680 [Patescibacteria group bacterium]|nr:hypothetical protein [Patescibacteria group bacterium]